MVNLGCNVSETVDLSARDSLIGVTENMVPATKNHKNIFKAFSFLIQSTNRIFWQKTTWATIMSRDDKTCIKQYFLNKQARKLQDAQAEKLTSLQANKLTS